jgi:hypothetical protein
MTPPHLQINNVSLTPEGREILDSLNLLVQPGEIHTLLVYPARENRHWLIPLWAVKGMPLLQGRSSSMDRILPVYP